MMNFVYRIFILLTATSLWFSLSGNQSGAATSGRSATGAPFGNGTCGSCHSGGRYGTVTVAIQIFEVGSTTPITNYVGGKTYDAKLTITATTVPPFYGFQMVAVNPSNGQAGTWSGFPTGVKGTTLDSRVHVEQSSRLAANSYKMIWVAPAAGTGKVTFYACGNCVNGSGNNSGDNTGTTTLTLTEQPVCTSATLATSSTNAACSGSATGSATVSPTGGRTPYTYLWSNGATTQTASNLLAGTYTVTVTEGGGCKTTSNGVTVGANTLAASITPSGATTFCQGGSVNLTASGGTSYKWSTGATTATLSNVTATGTYTVTVSNGTCTATGSKSVTVNQAPSVILTSTPSNGRNGTATATVTGGTSPYIYDWSNRASNNTISGLQAGTYLVTVTDSYGCTTSGSVIVKAVTGISEVNKTVTAHISPNPNNGHFTLTMELPKAQTVSIAVFNVIGQKLAHKTLKGKSISEQIDLPPLSMGTYLVRINTELGVLTQWMVIGFE